MLTHRWHAVAPSDFPWERDALDYLRTRLPDADPVRVWANAEFVSLDGRLNEVDAIVLTGKGLFLVEIKSRPGEILGDQQEWLWRDGLAEYRAANPLKLANAKSKRLADLLNQTQAARGTRVPYIEPVVFVSAAGNKVRLAPPLDQRVFTREAADGGQVDTPGIIAALTIADTPPGMRTPVNTAMARIVSRAMTEIGLRASAKADQVGDYTLGELLGEGPSYQDYLATHVSMKVQRRVRLYPIPLGASQQQRRTALNAARREFEILEGIHDTDIVAPLDYKETERGPALVFPHDPGAKLGSVGRFEVTGESDIDWVLLIDGQADLAHQKRIVSIAASVAPHAKKPVGREGTFGKMASSHDLVQYIGGGDDTNANFTRRMLLLLESRPIGNSAAYDRVVKVILERYLTGDHGWTRGRAVSGVPRFLLNDVLRYWRTIAVDYAYKQWTRDNKGWALRSAKLRLSRKLIYASGLASCFSLSKEPWIDDPSVGQDERKLRGIERLSAVCAQTPLDRLAEAFSSSSVQETLVRRTFDSYDSFLGILSDGNKRTRLEELESDAADADDAWAEVRELGSLFQDGLDALFFDDESTHYPKLIRRFGVKEHEELFGPAAGFAQCPSNGRACAGSLPNSSPGAQPPA